MMNVCGFPSKSGRFSKQAKMFLISGRDQTHINTCIVKNVVRVNTPVQIISFFLFMNKHLD